MRVLVLGGGGREHALCWALARDAEVTAVHCAPGNAGIAEVATIHRCDAADPRAVVALTRELGADLVVVGPEAPLVAGVADAVRSAGVPAFGPSAAAARIEGSKAFAKDVMVAAGVPTAGYWSGADDAGARSALDRFGAPYVVKADGLAGGKGVRICDDRAEAEAAVDDLLGGALGPAGRTIVIEEFLDGPEVSVFAVCDGKRGVPLATARDYKRAFDGDVGPNTGGMGAVSPAPGLPDDFDVTKSVIAPVMDELARRGCPYTGALYGGLILTADGPRVLEFNARFGDPEAQALLPRFAGRLSHLLRSAAEGALDETAVAWHREACVTVVLASGGYPGAYETGAEITGLAAAGAVPGATVFHAGSRRENERVLTDGGRVLAVSGLGVDVGAARRTAYAAADRIRFGGLQRRDDIAVSAGLPPARD